MTETVRSLLRGLDLLRGLNRFNGATDRNLVDMTGLSRGTVYRLMETLITAGYVRKDRTAGIYWLEPDVQELSDGFREAERISAVAQKHLDELCNQIEWPLTFNVPVYSSMVVRACTDHLTSLRFATIRIGQHLSMLNSASGWAYLAYCSQTQKERILEMLASDESNSDDVRLARDPAYITGILREVRSQGYSLRQHHDKMTALSVPAFLNGRCVGAIAVRYFTSAVRNKTEDLVTTLCKASSNISETWDHTLYSGKDRATLPAGDTHAARQRGEQGSTGLPSLTRSNP